MDSRGSFTGKLGFVLAAAGSAVGLGNIWRFPYVVAKYGGGIFLLTYAALALLVGCALMLSEIAIGRKTGLSVLEAFRALDRRFAFIGVLGAVVPALILPYYSVIGGWILKYLAEFSAGHIAATAGDGFFGEFISQTWSPLLWFVVFIGFVSLVVYFGVEKGIEKTSKILMPILALLTVFVAGYTCFLSGADKGIAYYLKPDISKFSLDGVLAAMSQMFYSLSLGMGIMVTYGSYVKKESNIESSVAQIAFFDTAIAFFAGLMVIPAVFVFLGEEGLGTGPGLIFVTLPKVFDSMNGGAFIGAAFFLLVLFAALTSAISLMEAVVASIQDKFAISRKKSIVITIAMSIVLGSLSSMGNGILAEVRILGMDFLSFFDYISNSVMVPIVAILTCVFVGYFLKPKTIIDEIELSGPFRMKAFFVLGIKYFAPICIGIVFISQFI